MRALDLETAMLILEKLDPISITNDRGEYIYANTQWLTDIGRSLDSLTGMHPWDILPDSKVQEVIATKEAILSHVVHVRGKPGFVSYLPVTRNGVFFGVLISVLFSGMETALKFSGQVEKLSRELENANAKLRNLSSAIYNIENIIGESRSVAELRSEIISAARTSSTVLIEGETGVGKELVAHSIHSLSKRSEHRFVRVNCSTIPETLAESELFGYEDGSFTGARKGGKAGKFELAQNGSIFLDEINQLPYPIQPKLLRVLQEREVERVGGKDVIPLNVRLIASTNAPLEEMVDSGEFREDLYYRLNVIRIRIPPLRERKEDIPLLTRNLVSGLNRQLDLFISSIDEGVYGFLQSYDWPGNVRELQNAIESAMNKADGEILKVRHFDLRKRPEVAYIHHGDAHAWAHDEARPIVPANDLSSFATLKADMEYTAIKDALVSCKGNKTEAAKLLGISRNALYKRIRKYERKRDMLQDPNATAEVAANNV